MSSTVIRSVLRHRGLTLGAAVVTGVSVLGAVSIGYGADSSGSEYTWKNVKIVGGGFIPGVEYSRAEKGLVYARTDIGGIYRRDPGSTTWVPLTDWVGPDNWGYNGPVSLAPDPVDADKVYAAVGMYTNSWDPNNGAVIRSSDRGRTWQVASLPFKQGGNMPGRGMGERLAVDPHKNSVLYLGTPEGNGLWRSTDSGATWSKVTSFTNTGDYAEGSDSQNYLNMKNGIVWVTFDPRSGSGTGAGAMATKVIYVGVADRDNTVYRSTDAGATWAPVKGTPTGYLAHKGVLDERTGQFYITTSNKAGPYEGSHGDVWRLDTSTDTWTQISPVPSSNTNDNYFGYSGLTVDRQKSGTLMVTAYSSWWPDTIMWRSTDSGATWSKAWDWTSYPNRSFRYTQDVSASPWLTWGENPSPPEVTPKLGWMTETMEIDPFNSDNLLYGTGASLYGTSNLTAWDSSGVKISVAAEGIEETAVLDLVSPPSGAHLISGLGDLGGFKHTDLDVVPSLMFTQPNFVSTTSLDFAETTPSVMVRAGNTDKDKNPNDKHLAFSTDGGSNWFMTNAEPSGVTQGGTVAAAADGSRFVWSPTGGQPSYAVGYGNSWTASKGLDTGAVVTSDRVNPKKFYAVNGGRFFASTDGGESFSATVSSGLPNVVQLRTVPGHEGDVWLATDSGLYHSTDSGASFAKAGGDKAWTVGFGKAAEGGSYPAIYSGADINGTGGIYRSDDGGTSWARINDDQHQWGLPTVTIGDPRIYGRVYVGTNGRGVVYGDGSGGTPATPEPTPTATPTGNETSSPATDPGTPTTLVSSVTPLTTSPDATSSSGRTSTCTAQVEVKAWHGGYLGTVTVLNQGAAKQPWTVLFTVPAGMTMYSGWNADMKLSGTTVTAAAPVWNRTLASGSEVSIGFVAAGPSEPPPSDVRLNGVACTVNGGDAAGG